MLPEAQFHSHALQAEKMQEAAAFNFYRDGMALNSINKASLISQNFPIDLENGSVVLDLGTCSGALVREMNLLSPEYRYVGVDLSRKMLQSAVEQSPFAGFIEADALHVPIKRGSVSVITMSSILHEIYSYAGRRFTVEAVHQIFATAKDLLRERGRLIIKDPAKPDNPDEELVFRLPIHDGVNCNDESLLVVEPKVLSTNAKYHRFLKQFHPMQTIPYHSFHVSINHEENLYKAPAWILSEFLRHRNLDNSPEIWNSEMMEMYGVFTKEEARNALSSHGYTKIEVNTFFNPQNHSMIVDDEITIWSMNGAKQNQPERLPTGILMTADKPLLL